jgi:hypothetical protein
LFKSARRVRPYGSAMFGITTSYSTGLPALDAREDFGRARRSRLTAQVGHCITGRALPPITLVRRPDGHYVIDGCHRVSVARARAPRHRRLGPARRSSR